MDPQRIRGSKEFIGIPSPLLGLVIPSASESLADSRERSEIISFLKEFTNNSSFPGIGVASARQKQETAPTKRPLVGATAASSLQFLGS